MKDNVKPGLVFMCCALVCVVGCRSASSYVEKGKTLAADGRTEEAMLNYRKAIQKDPGHGPAYLALGNLAIREREHAGEGYRMLKQAVSLMPDSDEAKVALADFSIGAYAASPKPLPAMYENARISARQLLDKDNTSFDGLRLSGSVAMLDRKPAEAVSFFKRANERKPWQDAVIVELVQAHIAGGEAAEGERLANEAISRNPKLAAMYEILYLQYMRTNRAGMAENLLKRKVHNLPDSAGPAFELARHYARSGNREGMDAALQQIQSDTKKFPHGRVEVAEFYTNLGQPERALAQIQAGLASASDSQKPLYQRAAANALLSLNRHAEARGVVHELLKANPNDASAQAVSASLLFQTGKPSDAAAAAEQLRSLAGRYPGRVEIVAQLAQALQAKGDYDGAALGYTQALKISDSPALRLALAQIRLEQKQAATALQLAKEVLDRQPQNVRAHLVHAAANAAAGNLEQARLELVRLPRSEEVDLQLAVIALAQGRHKEAEKTLQSIVDRNPANTKAVQWLAESHWAQRDTARSFVILNAYVEKNPEFIPIRLQLAAKAAAAGQMDTAIQQYTAVISKDPNWPEGHFNIGRALSAAGNAAAAEQHLRRATELAPKNATFWLGLADHQRLSGRLKDTESALRRAVELAPGDAMSKNNLAFIIGENGGNLDEAVRFAQDAVQIDRKQPAFSDTLGFLYLKNDLSSAPQVFSSLVKAYPGNPAIQYHYGEVLLRKGDKEGARTALAAALAQKPAPQDEARIRNLLAGI